MPGFIFKTFSNVPAGSRLRLGLVSPPSPKGSWVMSGTKRRGSEPLSTIHSAEFEDGDVEFLLRDAGDYEIRANMRRVKSDNKARATTVTATIESAAGVTIGAPFIGTLDLDASRTVAYAKFEVGVV